MVSVNGWYFVYVFDHPVVGLVTDAADFRSKLITAFFDLYQRTASDDSSGFEHCFCGEWKSSTQVNGFHNWIQFYELEKQGALDYYGNFGMSQVSIIMSYLLIFLLYYWGNQPYGKKLTPRQTLNFYFYFVHQLCIFISVICLKYSFKAKRILI